MNIEDIHDARILARGLRSLCDLIKNETGENYTQLAHKLGIHKSALSRAFDYNEIKNDYLAQFGEKTRGELFTLITNKTDIHIHCEQDSASKEIKLRIVEAKDLPDKKSLIDSELSIYRIYYWRGGKLKIGVGIMELHVADDKWSDATLIIDNNFKEHGTVDKPYIFRSTRISDFLGNTFIDFSDDQHEGLRQLGIFNTPKDVSERKIIEGVFATSTRWERNRPIAGVMLLERLSDDHKTQYIEKKRSSELTGNKVYPVLIDLLDKLMDIPAVIYDFLFGKRLETKARDYLSFRSLPNYENWYQISSFEGVYHGQYIRGYSEEMENFLVQIYASGEATIIFPESDGTHRGQPIEGRFKWVKKKSNLLTASFDYDATEDHWRFRLILEGEMDTKNRLFGILAGSESAANFPFAARVRLTRLVGRKNEIRISNGHVQTPDNEQHDAITSVEKPRYSINQYAHLLGKLHLESPEFQNLLNSDDNFDKFFSGEFKSFFTSNYHSERPLQQEAVVSKRQVVTEPEASEFHLSGDYCIYSLYHTESKYYILKQPVKIGKDRSVLLKTRGPKLVSGEAEFTHPVLKINFDKLSTNYTHILVTVNNISYHDIKHAFGVLTGVHVGTSRSEATMALLLGNKSSIASRKRKLDFDTSEFEQIEIGKKDFFKLDSGDPLKMATFISGHNDRYISPPADPNKPFTGRLPEHGLHYFRSACFSGLQYNVLSKKEPVASAKLKAAKDNCINALKEAFTYGFCNPSEIQIARSNSALSHETDFELLTTEFKKDGAFENLQADVLKICSDWGRGKIKNYLK